MTDFHCKMSGLLGGDRPWSTTVKTTGPLSIASMLSDFSAAVTTLWTTSTNGLENYITSDVTLTLVTVQQVGSTQRAVNQEQDDLALAGTASGDSLPWHEAPVVELLGAGNARTDRGWMYLPPLAESASASHVWTPAFMASAKLVFDVFFPAIRSGGMNVYSYPKVETVGGVSPFTKTNMVRYRIPNKPSTQRRRVRKVPATYTNGGAF